MYAHALENPFAREVRAGLTRAPQKTLPCRYFYDDAGSALFDAITLLPEYGLARADARVLQKHAGELAARLPRNTVVAELGSGSGTKTRPVLEALRARQPVTYYPIDVSPAALAKCALELNEYGAILPLEMSYLDGLRMVAQKRRQGQSLLLMFLGSTIGNFEPEAAVDFLCAIRHCLQRGDSLLLGTDLVKRVDTMLRAYDDQAGVTAAFNLNLLARIDRELDANFNLRQFEHLARYNAEAKRIEMHLRSRVYQIVSVRQADLTVELAADETICTETCHKFVPRQIVRMARLAGFRVDVAWTDEEWPFSENLLTAA